MVSLHTRYVVIDKPAGMLSVPGRGPDKADSAATRVQQMFPEARGPVVVHRLDMDTSGLLVFALDPAAQRFLSVQFMKKRVSKRYVAVLDGDVPDETGDVHLPLRVDWPNRPRHMVDPEQGKPAHTRYRVIARSPWGTRVWFEPVTGRTHQLRLHAADQRGLDAPIVGDPLYHPEPAAPRMMLHAEHLEFSEPGTKRRVSFHAPAPF